MFSKSLLTWQNMNSEPVLYIIERSIIYMSKQGKEVPETEKYIR